MWARLLRVERAGVFDNFFELGGHSVLATTLITEVNAMFQVEVSLRTIFETPTIAELGKEILRLRSADHRPPELEIKPISRKGREARHPEILS